MAVGQYYSPMEKKPQDSESRSADKYIVRFPEGMRDKIAEAAKANGRSMNSEIVARLESSESTQNAVITLNLVAHLEFRLAQMELKEKDAYLQLGMLARHFLICLIEFPKAAADPGSKLAEKLKEWTDLAEKNIKLSDEKTLNDDISELMRRMEKAIQMISPPSPHKPAKATKKAKPTATNAPSPQRRLKLRPKEDGPK